MITRKRKLTEIKPIKKETNQEPVQNPTKNAKQKSTHNQETEKARLSDTELQLISSTDNYGTPLLFCMMKLDNLDPENPKITINKDIKPTDDHKKETTAHIKALKALAEKKIIPSDDDDIQSVKEKNIDLGIS